MTEPAKSFIQLTPEAMRRIYPRAPQAVIDAFVKKQDVLFGAGINHTRARLAFALSQVEHECNGYAIPRLTENLNYSASRLTQVWPSRFPNVAAASAYAGQPAKLANKVYGGRMGNRPGTADGSLYIGRGGPQITGRDGYANVGKRCGLDLVNDPELAAWPQHQPEILAGFWSWKNLNPVADAGDFHRCTKIWNGGYIGEADRQRLLAGNKPILDRLAAVERIKPILETVPGAPPTATPPKDVIADATKDERRTRNAGGVTAGTGTVVKTGVEQPDKHADAGAHVAHAWILPTVMVIGAVLFVVGAIAVWRKTQSIKANWR